MTQTYYAPRAEHRSLWLREAMAGEADAPRLEGTVRADVCIVGGGYTGMWTALRLRELEPSLNVVLVEADVMGGGASGRNAGVLQSIWIKFYRMRQLFGTDEALRLGAALDGAVDEIDAFCRAHGIDAELHRDGWLWVATTPLHIGAWRGAIDELARFDIRPFVELTSDELAQRGHSPYHLAGVLDATAGSVHPAKLARGLRRVVLERGVQVFERSPMVSLDRSTPPVVRTPGGEVRASTVVLAINAWSARLPEIGSLVLPLSSDMIATAPVPGFLESIGWTDGLTTSDSRMLVHYYRTTADARVLFGKGGGTLAFAGRIGDGFNGELSDRRRRLLTAALHDVFPQLRTVPITDTWNGPIDRTQTGIPLFGRLGKHPSVVFGAGYSGIGVAPSLIGGRILASLALRRDDEWSRAGFVRTPRKRFPPEPLRFLGGRIVQAAVARRERAEQDGAPVGRIAGLLSQLAPPGYLPPHTPSDGDAPVPTPTSAAAP
jgi:glycine/D-amino acid oxidase-like deaminating enzyme